MNYKIELLIVAICSYLFGNFNWAILISKLKKTDVRTMGSGNPGTLNMGRNFGLKIGLLVFFLDILKGVIPTLITYFLFRDKGYFENTQFLIKDLALYLSGLCVVLGHIYPVVFKFKGGKGIASSIGVFLFVEFSYSFGQSSQIVWGLIVVMALVAASVFIYLTEFGAMGSFIAITPSAISAFIRLNYTYYGTIVDNLLYYLITSFLLLFICFITWFAHRGNIERMLSGNEHATSIRELFIKAKAKKQEAKQNKTK